MKNHKAMSGVAYMFLGAAMLVGGPAVQEQIDQMAQNQTLQLAKAMYQSMTQQTEAKPQVAVLADAAPAAARQFDAVAVATAPAVPKVESVATVEVVAPKIEVELAQLPVEQMARIKKMTSKLKPAKFAFVFERVQASSFAQLKALEMKNFVMLQKEEIQKKAECDNVQVEIERMTEI